MNQPVWTDEDNLSRSACKKGGGKVKASVTAEGRYIHITPNDALDQAAVYVIRIQKGFEAFDQRVIPETLTHERPRLLSTRATLLKGIYVHRTNPWV